MTDTTPHLDLPYILASQAQKEVTHNEALNRLDAALHASVRDRHLTAPPSGSADGDRHLVAAGATGAWAGQEGKLAAWYDGWIFLSPVEGWAVWVADEAVNLRYDGAAWAEVNNVTSVQGRTGAVSLTAGDVGLGQGDNVTFAGLALSAVASKLASAANIVAVVMYDTAKDSDGGAWVAGCRHLSWYNEALGTATRGSARPFPKLALIVATTTTVTIHDAGDPALPMWMVFNSAATSWLSAGGRAITSLAAGDGKLVIGRTGEGAAAGMGVAILDFPADSFTGRRSASAATLYGMVGRNAVAPVWASGAAGAIADGRVNGVDLTALPFAPPDPATGLPRPTIAVATDGGVSVIHADGNVRNSAMATKHDGVAFGDGFLLCAANTSNSRRLAPLPALFTAGWGFAAEYGAASTPALLGGAALPSITFGGSRFACGTTAGVTICRADLVKQANGMVAHITKDHATGWLPGDIRLALAEKDTASLVGGTVADRSGKANDLSVNGTITRTAVAAGADLTAYGGFGAANYLSRAADADFDFGTGDFAILLWYSAGAESANVILDRAVAEAVRIVLSTAAGVLRFTASGATGTANVDGIDIRSTGYRMIVAVRRGARIELWLDGRMVGATAAPIGSVNSPTAALTVGRAYHGGYPLSAAARIALPRIAAYAPGPERIARIYADEAPLFQPGAKCLLGGTSNQVKALAHDPDTDRLLAAGPDGTSIFRGLTRVGYIDGAVEANLTSDDHNAVAAARGGYLIASAAEAVASLPALNLREEPGRVRERAAPELVRGGTTDATPTDLFKLSLAEGRSLLVEAVIEAREQSDAPTERAAYTRRALFHRDVGGNVTLAGAVTAADLHESTAGMDCTLKADTAAQTVDLNVTGVAGKAIGWAARLSVIRLPGEERLP